MITTKVRRRVAAMVLLATIAAGTPARAAAPPAVAPPTAHPNGASYAEWSARWWQWAFGTAGTPGGPFDEGSIDCGADQPEDTCGSSPVRSTSAAANRVAALCRPGPSCSCQ